MKEYYVDLNQICSAVVEYVKAQGFETPTSITETNHVLAKLALIMSELGEAVEGVRHHDMANLQEELADTCIRVFDLCGHMGIDLGKAIADKMEKNLQRPFKHGKQA